MSLFDDEKIKILLASVVAKEHLKKYADTIESEIQTFRLAQPLISNLEQKIDPSVKEDATAFRGSELPVPTQPDVSNFRTLGDFIRWAADNRLTWKGKRFAWRLDDLSPKPADVKRYDAMHPTREREESREPITDQFDVDQGGLVGYLTSIRDHEAVSNKVLEVLIKSNINEINSLNIFGGEPIDPKATISLEKDIPDDAIIDGFGSSYLLGEDSWNRGLDAAPLFSTSSATLKGKDIKSVGAFQVWFGNLKTLNKEKFEKSVTGAEGLVSPLSPEGDPCLAFYILHKRASFLKDRAQAFVASNPSQFSNYPKYINAYLGMIDKLKDMVKDPVTGGSCNLFSPKPTGGLSGTQLDTFDTSRKPGGEEGYESSVSQMGKTVDQFGKTVDQFGKLISGPGVAGKGKDTGPSPYLIENIVRSLPLRAEIVSFNLIATFLASIAQLDDMEINKLILDVQQSMAAAIRNTRDNKDSLNLNVSWSIDPRTKKVSNPLLMDMAGPNQQASFCNYISHVEAVVNGVLEIITLFKTKYERHLVSPYAQTTIVSQIGSGSYASNSLYGMNIREIHKMQQWAECPKTF